MFQPVGIMRHGSVNLIHSTAQLFMQVPMCRKPDNTCFQYPAFTTPMLFRGQKQKVMDKLPPGCDHRMLVRICLQLVVMMGISVLCNKLKSFFTCLPAARQSPTYIPGLMSKQRGLFLSLAGGT